MCNRLIQFYKIIAGETPMYLRDNLPPSRRNMITLPNVFQEFRCRTNRYFNSFFPNATSNWNKIISNFEHLPTLDEFKNHLNLLFRPRVKSTFGVHDPLYLRYIFQLRVGLSPLKSHKKNHHFADTNSDLCSCSQSIEDNKHFLLECYSFMPHRALMLNSVNEILRKNNLTSVEHYEIILLYGHSSLSFLDNKNILLATLKFIKSTNRFSN